VENLNQVIKRELFSEKSIFVDALDGREGDMQWSDTIMSISGDELDGDDKLEVKETMEIAVVAEVHDGMAYYCVVEHRPSDNPRG
jgi:hypothetical protein